jgi:uncharacterized repeat protein (TIGR03837 family)
MPRLQWDIFCRVIDNFGDIGVCWRLSSALAARGQAVRLWADDASALAWMAPDGYKGVEVRHWRHDQPMPSDARPGDVVIEAFGCELDSDWITMNSIALTADSTGASGQKGLKIPVWINLEYLSAESYVARSHGLACPVMQGAAQGLTKWFFYPGFTASTGGLIREPDAISEAAFEAPGEAVYAGPVSTSPQRMSLFCYEPPALADLLGQLADAPHPTELTTLPGRGRQALACAISRKNDGFPLWNVREALLINEQTYLSQPQFDALLRACHLNFVRGEDSLVRAIWAGRAFVWQIYPQSDRAHELKLEAFLDWLQAPPDLREFHRIWNGCKQAALPPLQIEAWTRCARAARSRLLEQRDLVSQLLDFVEEKAVAAI